MRWTLILVDQLMEQMHKGQKIGVFTKTTYAMVAQEIVD